MSKETMSQCGLEPRCPAETWDTVKKARMVERPRASDYLASFNDFDELRGDRMHGDCRAVVAGTAMFDQTAVMLLGQEKGRDLTSRMAHNFGMPRPEAYRKARRLYQLAERWSMPIVIFLDSPGAYAGVDAEMRNQSEAIANNILAMTALRVPIVVFVIGEAMSGGAMAMGVADRTYMLSNAIYSVISPEGCSGILWKDKAHTQQAAAQMAVTAASMFDLGYIDGIVDEPGDGAHTDPALMIQGVHDQLRAALKSLMKLSPDDLVASRQKKLLSVNK